MSVRWSFDPQASILQVLHGVVNRELAVVRTDFPAAVCGSLWREASELVALFFPAGTFFSNPGVGAGLIAH